MTAKAEALRHEPLSTARELALLRDLQRLANERHDEEGRVRTALNDGLAAAKQALDDALQSADRHTADARANTTAEFEQKTTAARERYEKERDAAQKQYKGLRQGVESEHSRVTEAARNEQQQLNWEAMAVFDALRGRPRERYLETVQGLQRNIQELTVLERDAAEIMKMRRQWRDFPQPTPTPDQDASANHKAARVVLGRTNHEPRANTDSVEEAMARVGAAINAVRDAAVALNQQKLPRLFEGGYPFGVFFLVWIAAAVPCGLLLSFSSWQWVAASLVLAIVVSAAVLLAFWPKARRQGGEQFQRVQQLAADARQAVEAAHEAAVQRGRREAQALLTDRDQELAAVEEKVHAIVSEKERWKESQIGSAGQTFPSLLAELREEHQRSIAAAEQEYKQTLSQLTEQHDHRAYESRRQYDERCHELRKQHDEAWDALAERWREGLSEIVQAFDDINAQCARLFPDWDVTDYDAWPKPVEPAAAIRFGQLTLDLAQVKHGVPRDERLRPDKTVFDLPALVALDEHPALVITSEEDGRRSAIELLQLVMLRFLTAMPPGKVRFTILDPVGLGESFASFMHLADFDELLIASRIWTDGRQIEEQLTRLTAHMETVLQKYLRNEFATIHEYNAQAGEVAEPFQVLVAANFPTNFSEAAARKLVSIATSGPRCGVYTLLSVDRKQRLPTDFALADLLATAVHLDWVAGVERQRAPSSSPPDVGHFRWRYSVLERLPLAVDRGPTADRFNEVVRLAGRAAKDSMKVEVPFELVAPEKEKIWNGTTGKEMVVPIGRAGAMRLQSVRLGRGTSQHLLVCGKTGSGKSTFLHALITNAALYYSPDEVEFYLIDFKKGVEFKTYATHRLPHARVIAIESEREFGLSVLERLDAELRRRGDLLRSAGVQDLPDFRVARPDVKMPRVLLVIDEFQELFVEDDKLSQEAALLLDRLVRQGRAFGIHVLLGSQTLSGAYSLARSTMGQMAVRVALQCSETDASLILSDERNMAARFLSRPGEAIYNDQNGLLAGNSPFQVVWLGEQQRIGYLRQIEAKSAAAGVPPAHTIVFEGDQLADPAGNPHLRELLNGSSRGQHGGEQKAWLGDAVAIKDPTSITFARHAGSNLLVVGAWDDSALGVMANAVIALAAQNVATNAATANSAEPGASSSPQPLIYVLDGTRAESPEAGAWQRLADALPQAISLGGPRDVTRIINDLAVELARREAASQDDAPPIYLVIFNGGRFRELRRGEDDYSFSFDKDKPPSPDKQFAELIRNGPAWGIHTLLWCDSYNNISRLLDRAMLREFELRIAFQMSAADSASLLDNPAASRLRQHRGLIASEDVGTLEKFRPYGPPNEAWLEIVRKALSGNSQAR